jgi:transcriptional regulator with XRE-family HTH domain
MPEPDLTLGRRISREHIALGRAVREMRARRGLSQEQLGFRCDLHRNYVGAIERGEINPTFRVLLKLERGLQMPLSEITQCYERHEREQPPDLVSSTVEPSALVQ